MNNRIIGFALLALFVGILTGWLSSDIDTPSVSDNDAWQAFETTLTEGQSPSDFANTIKASGVIEVFLTQAEKDAADAQESEDDGLPPLPTIIGTSVINGTAQVHLKILEERPITLLQGEVLENGWVLKTVNLNGVVFQYDEIEHHVLIKEYDLTPADITDRDTLGEKENL